MKLVLVNVSPAMARRPLGRVQRSFLKCCRDYGSYGSGGWVWGCRSLSKHLADGLVARGLLAQYEDSRRLNLYKITEAGLAVLAAPAPENTKEQQP